MRNLLNSRGSVALATAIALVPIIGFVAIGTEAGLWYVTKQQAQNAADAAAYSGGLTLACALSGTTGCDTASYVDRGELFAARNGFCNTGATYDDCPTGRVQTVAIDRGTYSAGAFTVDAAGDSIRATVRQQETGILTAAFGVSTFNIGAQAIVTVQTKKDVCALGLGPQTNGITIGGSSEITGDGCAMMSDTAIKFNSEPTFVGSNWAVQSVNGCSGGHCDVDVPYNYSALPARNPLSVLDDKSFNDRTGNTNPLNNTACPSPLPTGAPTDTNKCYSMTPNSASGGAYKGFTINNKEYVDLAPGTYFFYNATIKVTGGYVTCSTCTGIGTSGVTLVLLGSSSISISGGKVILNAPPTNSFDSSLNGVLIDDQAPTHASNNVTIGGGSNVQLGGVMYFPNVEVTWNGTTENPNTSCTQVIANSITISGNSYLSSAGCAAGTVPKTQVVALVQ